MIAVFFIRLLLTYKKKLSLIKFLVGIALYSLILSSIFFLFVNNSKVRVLSICSVLVSVLIKFGEGSNIFVRATGKFLKQKSNLFIANPIDL